MCVHLLGRLSYFFAFFSSRFFLDLLKLIRHSPSRKIAPLRRLPYKLTFLACPRDTFFTRSKSVALPALTKRLQWKVALRATDSAGIRGETSAYYLTSPTKVGSPQQLMPITVDTHYLTHPVNFPCGRKPEYPEKTHDLPQSVDLYSFHKKKFILKETGRKEYEYMNIHPSLN